MRNLPAYFTELLRDKSRIPIILLEINFESDIYLLSDREIFYGDREIIYQPWVESWGMDNGGSSASEGITVGGRLEVPSQRLSLILSPASKGFINDLLEAGAENTPVKIYLTFEGLDHEQRILVASRILQDPISVSEGTMTMQVDAVHEIMLTDPYLVQSKPGVKRFPFAVGKAPGVNLELMEDISDAFTTLAEGIDGAQIGKVYAGNTSGFPATGNIVIDEETLSYSEIKDSSFIILSRGVLGSSAAIHSSGAGIYRSYHPTGVPPKWYYAPAAGPVNDLDNVQANEIPYKYIDWEPIVGIPHVIKDTSSNPCRFVFQMRPPWLGSESIGGTTPITPDPVYSDYFAATTEIENNEPAGSFIIGQGNVNIDNSGTCLMRILSDSGGGSSTKQADSTSVTSINLFGTDPEHIHGSKSIFSGRFIATYLANVGADPVLEWYPPDNEIASISWKQSTNFSSLGTLDTQRISFDLSCRTVGCDYTVRIYFIDSSSSATLLETLTNNNYVDPTIGSFATWSGDTFEYDVSAHVSDFNDLVGAEIKVEVEMTAIRQLQGCLGFLEVTQIKWLSDYTDEPVDGFPTQEVMAKQVSLAALENVISMQGHIEFRVDLDQAETEIEISFRGTSDPTDNDILDTIGFVESTEMTTYDFNLYNADPGDLYQLRFGLRQTLKGITEAGIMRRSDIYIKKIWFTMETQGPDYYDVPETRIIFPENITCDVTSIGGADETPAALIQRLMDTPTVGGYADTSSFADAHADYDTAGYYFNGLLDPDSTYHSALREAIKQGFTRLAYDLDSGGIGLLPYWEESTADPDIFFYSPQSQHGNIIPRSRTIPNGITSNYVAGSEISYSFNYLYGAYDGVSSSGSNVTPERRELSLIRSEAIADMLADRVVELKSISQRTFTLKCLMDYGFRLEKGDTIALQHFITGAWLKGELLNKSWDFQLGKSGKINSFEIGVYSPVPTDPPIPGDFFAAPILISGHTGSVTGSNVEATLEPSEPLHAGEDGGHSIWFRWRADRDGDFVFNTFDSDFDTVLAVYTGDTIDNLLEIASNDDYDYDNDIVQSQVVFEAERGTVYYIAIDGYDDIEEGNYKLTWSRA